MLRMCVMICLGFCGLYVFSLSILASVLNTCFPTLYIRVLNVCMYR